MTQIQNIDIHNFTLNGINYKKIFIAIPVGNNHIKIICAYDSKLQLLPPTKVSDILVDGIALDNSESLINELSNILFSKETTYVSSQFKIYNTIAEAQALDPKPENGILFQVSKVTDINNSGYYSFQSGEANGTRFEYPIYEQNEIKIQEAYVLIEGKTDFQNFEVGDKFRAWLNDRYVVGKVIATFAGTFANAVDDNTKINLVHDSEL
jgi:hypothetical protein